MIDERTKQRGREVAALKLHMRLAIEFLEGGHPGSALEKLQSGLRMAERIEGRGLEHADAA